MKINVKYIPLLIFLLVYFFFSRSFFLSGRLPFPADTLVGLYYPFRDIYAATNPNGIPFKNSLITDPVLQQYPWRFLSIEQEKQFQLPLWNPYNFSGTPLLANFQSGALYPLNLLFFVFPFTFAWSLLVLLQPLLAGMFLYAYLRKIAFSRFAALLGGMTFAFCGFSVAWMEWGTILQTILWLPLILLAKEHLLQKSSKTWIAILIFAISSALLAGHLQTFFYLCCFHYSYLFFRIIQITKNEKGSQLQVVLKKYLPFFFIGCVIVLITAVQWISTLQLISLSARTLDQQDWQSAGWFIPWQQLIQFIAPDFFGNPTTGNYWGTWNYGELVGYVGVFPLLFASLAFLRWKDAFIRFFASWLGIGFLFALPNVISFLPFQLHIPFLSTSQPTRLLSIIDFCLAILAAKGFDAFLDGKIKRNILFYLPAIVLGGVTVLIWSYVLFLHKSIFSIDPAYVEIAKKNLYLPTLFVAISIVLLIIPQFVKHKKVLLSLACIMVLFTALDQLRFTDKFMPFVQKEYVYPSTQAITFLQTHTGSYRIMSTDRRILPPNVSAMYHLQTIDGYDPLYLKWYGQLISFARGDTNYQTKLPFNRIIASEPIIPRVRDFLGVKYVLSLSDLNDPTLHKVFTDGHTQIYENTTVMPRAFIDTFVASNISDENVLHDLFQTPVMRGFAYINEKYPNNNTFSRGQAEIKTYSPNYVNIQTQTGYPSFLVLTDAYYPTWHATIDGLPTHIYRTDYAFRGVAVPAGTHVVEFTDTLF